ncbi:MAG: hypothetical protein GYB66_06105 [Chloroflexi bacterium]|nr:hypothetical protein [Chloroflexota bacterium]
MPLLLNDIAVYVASFKQGKAVYQLDDLQDLPDETLAEIRPAVNPEYAIVMLGGHVQAQYQSGSVYQDLFPVESFNYYLFHQFDGTQTLGAISRRAARKLRCDPEQAFAQVRELFLALVKKSICLPQEPRKPENKDNDSTNETG